MNINKIKYKIFYIFFFSFYLSSSFGNWVSAKETQILTTNEIEKKAIDHLVKTLPWDKKSLEVNVYYQGKDIILPNGKKDLIYKIMGSTKRAGRIPMILEIRINDKFQKRIQFNTKVLVSQKVIKTIRVVKRGKILSDDEIRVETIQTERPSINAITNIDYALGYEALRRLPIGKILLQNFIKKPALGNRGDKVLITAKKGAMTITTPGILKEDGYEDAMVRVLNMESKKIIYGRLIDSNTVKVSF
jgi:flagellar basal body P-ring formation protein FlgA